ncbi:collagen-binding protein [Polaribacter pacificus]|uniref:Collagen-binding protein n=2 Tax=Polaribacter pacificus TaxID=1775173 RepID=A0A917HUA9_9FLAO|nr:collagen-binding protein [Polaribacter pacificus]
MLFGTLFSQGVIKGKVIDANTREGLPFVSVIVLNTQIGATTDERGEFIISNTPLGYLKLQASFIGYETVITEDYLTTKDKIPFVSISLKETSQKLDEVVIANPLFKKSMQSPLSLQSLGIAEIEKNPGGNRDVLKVIQSLPGVASNPGFRNDIIIRGGATSENAFYLDGIEIPVINHFQTQGATGGPVGIINADLIRKVDFYTSAFPSNRGNALSSVISFTQKTGNPNSLNTRVTLGTSDAGITLDGPLTSSTTFMASFRQSYLQLLFKLIKLPFLPTYNDFQVNVKSTFSDNSQLSIIMVGAIDNFKLNESVNDGVVDEETIKRNRYILSNIPVQEQWNYTIGANYKIFGDGSNQQFILSRSAWNNDAIKYFNNTGQVNDLLLKYASTEVENKFRYENNRIVSGFDINFGAGLQQATYTNNTYNKTANSQGGIVQDFSSELSIGKYALFGQVSKKYLDERMGVSFGFRMDGNTYNSQMKNLFNQFSPRVAVSYALTNKWSLNTSLGRYYQLPSYTSLGYRDIANTLVNQEQLTYIQADHFVSGIEFKPDASTKITLEGFYKKYGSYPFSVRNQISLANLGDDFGVIGSEEVTSTSKGNAYGFEVFAQKKSTSGLYGIFSYTFVRSEFQDQQNNYVPSNWDNKHLLTLTAGKKFNKDWELGTKFRLVGGKPYTPYDLNASSLISNYDLTNRGILDYSRLNTERFDTYTQLDVRIDKTWYWKRFSLNFYIDVQNVLASKTTTQSFLLPSLDANGNKLTDPNDANRYLLEDIENSSGNVLPGFGFIVDF